ncbi:MAG: hypothetical protein K8S98_09545 [Planctomycetes bacterium]|nr:hypothetical protein [Planctomycetota bacterium]
MAALSVAGSTASAGTWTKLIHNAPQPINLMLQLSDGTVMAARFDNAISNVWYKLTPDATGSYVNGTWTTLAAMHDTRLYYPSQVLRDGRVFVAGGEYGSGGGKAEVYDPLTNVWTQTNPPAGIWSTTADNFYDCNSEMLPDGKVLLMPVFPHTSGIPLRYDPATNTWSNAGKLFRGTWQDEASWVKLPDDTILTIDPWGQFSERYVPSTNKWIDDGVLPLPMYDPFGEELGGALLLPNGKSFWLGSTGHTMLYTPSGSTAPGVWIAGPDIPSGKGTPDAPCAALINGNVLCAVSPMATAGNHFPSPTTFYEYDPVANAFVSVGAPVGSQDNISTYQAAMLDLPDGKVLYSHMGSDVYVYTPTGGPIAAGKPTITSLTGNLDGSYHLVGTGLNGISAGATYGDDLQMNTNYPLVRLVSGSNVYYARTYNWSSTGVMTGSTPVSTEFRLPAGFPSGSFSLYVVANGFASDPWAFNSCPLPVAYCTAKVNSQFCIPAIGYSGSASASSAAPFDVTGSQFLNKKFGLLFYGLASNGTAFQGGHLCVKLPVVRTTVQSSGGSPSGIDCTGTYTYDFNALIQGGSDPTLVANTAVYAQYWARDPQDFTGFGTSLSEGLTFTICP